MRLILLAMFAVSHGTFTTKRMLLPAGPETHTYVKNSSGILRGVYAREGTNIACYDGKCGPNNGVCYAIGQPPDNTIWDNKGIMFITPDTGIPFHKSLCCCTQCGGSPCLTMVWYD